MGYVAQRATHSCAHAPVLSAELGERTSRSVRWRISRDDAPGAEAFMRGQRADSATRAPAHSARRAAFATAAGANASAPASIVYDGP